MTQIADDLKTTREIVATRWCKGKGHRDGYGPGGEVCIDIALANAVGVTPLDKAPEWDWWKGRFIEAHDELQKHLPDGHTCLWRYNDAPGVTRADILDLIDKTLADLGEL